MDSPRTRALRPVALRDAGLSDKPGQRTTVAYTRNGASEKVDVTLGEQRGGGGRYFSGRPLPRTTKAYDSYASSACRLIGP